MRDAETIKREMEAHDRVAAPGCPCDICIGRRIASDPAMREAMTNALFRRVMRVRFGEE